MRLIESKQQEQREKEKSKATSASTSQSSLISGDILPSYNLNESISSLIQLSGIDISQTRDINNKQK